MTVATRKFNPGFLTEDELVASFCVRTQEFESIVETLRGCTGNSNQHQIVIGPRGSGKTTLLLRVAAEIGRDAELSRRLLPIRFAEESYQVSTAGEFWLECLSQLSNQAPCEGNGPDLRQTSAELRTLQDDSTLADRCLGAVLDYSDRQGKRLVLLVENLNMMFRDMVDPDAGWRLRHTLQTESRIVLVASATSRFGEIDDPNSALYELLRVHTLAPLDTDECMILWEAESGESPSREEVRPLEILTGGSPRLLAVVARMGAGRSLADLLDHLLDLIDDHTEYFKSHIEALPAQERRVYLALAELWEPATTKEVAVRARLDTNKCSAHLKRLTDRGVVRRAGGTARRKQFYLTERLYNIYYLLRRNRGPQQVVRALLQFMASYYAPLDLVRMASSFVSETVKPEGPPSSHRALHEALLEQLPLLAELPSGVRTNPAHHALLRFTTAFGALSRHLEEQRFEEALAATESLLGHLLSMELSEDNATVVLTLGTKAMLLSRLERPREAVASCSEALDRAGPDSDLVELLVQTLHIKASSLRELGRSEEALGALHELDKRAGESEEVEIRLEIAAAHLGRAMILQELGRNDEAIRECDALVLRFGACESVEMEDRVARALVEKGKVLFWTGKHEEALETVDEALRRLDGMDIAAADRRRVISLIAKGATLRMLERPDAAREIYATVLADLAKDEAPADEELRANALLEWASLELECGEHETAGQIADRVVALDLGSTSSAEVRAFLIRALASLADDRAKSERDIVAALDGLPALGGLPVEVPTSLMTAAIHLGPARVLKLINESPSSELLLPLKTALEQELGDKPRVAREIEEVAKDIRQDLEALRETLGVEDTTVHRPTTP